MFSLQMLSTSFLKSAVRELGYGLHREAQYPHCDQDLSLSQLLCSGNRDEVKRYLTTTFLFHIYAFSLLGGGAHATEHIWR